MKLPLTRSRLTMAAVIGATAALAFTGGVAWTHSASTADAASALAADPQKHGFLGLMVAPVTDEVAAKLNITKQDGLAVVDVVADGPAAKAGVQKADVIKSVNGTAVTDLKAGMQALRTINSGDTVQLSIARGIQTLTIAVTAGDAPARAAKPGRPGAFKPGVPPMMGGLGALGGLGMLGNLPELQGIAPGEMFDHFTSATFNLKDKNNADLTVTLTAGKVTSASDTSLTITPNAGGTATYALSANTATKMKGSQLQAGDKVVVVTKNGGAEALGLMVLRDKQAARPGRAAPGGAANGGNATQGFFLPKVEIERNFQGMWGDFHKAAPAVPAV